MVYTLIPLAMKSDNLAKKLENAKNALPQIMRPHISLVPPAPKLGYGVSSLPTWGDTNEDADALLCKVTQKAQGIYLPPKVRDPQIDDRTIARLS